MSRNILRTTEVTLIIKILGTTERTIIIKLQGNNTGCMPVLLQKGYYQDFKRSFYIYITKVPVRTRIQYLSMSYTKRILLRF